MVGNVHFQKSSRFAVSFVFALMCFLTSASAASVEKDASLVPDSHAKPKPPVTTIVSAARREIPIENSRNITFIQMNVFRNVIVMANAHAEFTWVQCFYLLGKLFRCLF